MSSVHHAMTLRIWIGFHEQESDAKDTPFTWTEYPHIECRSLPVDWQRTSSLASHVKEWFAKKAEGDCEAHPWDPDDDFARAKVRIVETGELLTFALGVSFTPEFSASFVKAGDE